MLAPFRELLAYRALIQILVARDLEGALPRLYTGVSCGLC